MQYTGPRGADLVPASAAVEFRTDLVGHPAQLLQHALRGTEGAQDELGGPRLHVLLDLLDEAPGGTEGGALPHGRLVHAPARRSEEHTSELQSPVHLVCRPP